MAQSLETLRSNNVTSIRGRRLGLQQDDTIAGPKDLKLAIEDITSTVPTTALAYGVTRILTSGSSQGPVQHNLPVPIPGVRKLFIMQTTSTGSHQFLSTPNGASILSASDGTTKSLLNFTGPGGSMQLIGADHGRVGSHRCTRGTNVVA
jgi:hypothetical protein